MYNMKKLTLFSVLWILLSLSLHPLVTTYAASSGASSAKMQSKNATTQKTKNNNSTSASQKQTKTQNSAKENSSSKSKNTKANSSKDRNDHTTQKVQTNNSEKNSTNQAKSQNKIKKSPDEQSKNLQDSTTAKTNSADVGDATFANENLNADDWKIELKDSPSEDDDFSSIKGNKNAFNFFNNKVLVLSTSVSLITLSAIGIILFSLIYIRNSKVRRQRKHKKTAAHFRLF